MYVQTYVIRSVLHGHHLFRAYDDTLMELCMLPLIGEYLHQLKGLLCSSIYCFYVRSFGNYVVATCVYIPFEYSQHDNATKLNFHSSTHHFQKNMYISAHLVILFSVAQN